MRISNVEYLFIYSLYSLEVTLRYFWKDTRIKPLKEQLKGHDKSGSYVNLHQSMADKIWMPDAFIDQAINLRQPKYFYEPSSLRYFAL